MTFTVLDMMEEEAINSPSMYDCEDWQPEEESDLEDREYEFDE